MTNIFSGDGLKASFAKLVYEELMKRQFVSYADILTIFYNREAGYYDKFAPSREIGVGELKKAFPSVVKVLNEREAGCVSDNGKKGKGKAYVYHGKDDDPLCDMIQSVAQKSIENYVAFKKLYSEWWSMDQMLTNINLLPILNRAISDRKVLRFKYKPYSLDEYELVFHPQFMKEYNGRWYVFGRADREPFDGFNVAIDRIVGEIEELQNLNYIAAKPNYYQNLFKKIVGVTHLANANVEKIVLRSHNIYIHGLLATKPIHESQIEIRHFSEYEDGKYGEFSLDVEINKELQGRILAFGSAIEVVAPANFREKLRKEIDELICRYH